MKYAEQEGHDDRRRRRQRARPGQRQRQGRHPRPADDARHDAGRLRRPVRPVRGAGRDPGRRRRGVDRQRRERVLGDCCPAPPAPNDTNFVCKPTSDAAPADRRRAARTSWPTTATTARGSTSPRRAGPASSTCPSGTAAARPGFPYTDADGTKAWEDFSITSNWALEIPCFTFTGRRLPGRPVLQHHPGHLDGDPARVGRAGPDRQRQAEARPQPGRRWSSS